MNSEAVLDRETGLGLGKSPTAAFTFSWTDAEDRCNSRTIVIDRGCCYHVATRTPRTRTIQEDIQLVRIVLVC